MSGLSMTVDIKEFDKALQKLQASVARDKVMVALKAGGLVVQNAAKLKAPKKTRTLSRSIHIEEVPGEVAVQIGTDVVYAAIQEFGGVITPKRAKMLAFEVDGVTVFAHAVTIPAHPYLRPAMDENKAEIQAEITASLRELLGAT